MQAGIPTIALIVFATIIFLFCFFLVSLGLVCFSLTMHTGWVEKNFVALEFWGLGENIGREFFCACAFFDFGSLDLDFTYLL